MIASGDRRVAYDPPKEWMKIKIDVPYDRELIELVKEIPASYFSRKTQLWSCPLASLPEVIELLEPEDFHIEEELKEKLPEAKKEREKGWKRVMHHTRQKGITIAFPYDDELVELVGNILDCDFEGREGIWISPLAKLPEVIELLEPKDFHIEEELKEKLPEVKQLPRNQFLKRVDNGEESAFVPAENAVLTRKLTAREAYEVVREKVSRYQQRAGIMVLEKDVLEVLSEMGASTDPEPRLCELLKITWKNSKQGKDKKNTGKYLSGEYRYMKKDYLLDELCRVATKQETYKWGWKKDPDPPSGAEWVLYFERDGIQCSFHSVSGRGEGPEFPGEWDGIHHDSFPFRKYLPDKEHRVFS